MASSQLEGDKGKRQADELDNLSFSQQQRFR